jgi:hypothetical protein
MWPSRGATLIVSDWFPIAYGCGCFSNSRIEFEAEAAVVVGLAVTIRS